MSAPAATRNRWFVWLGVAAVITVLFAVLAERWAFGDATWPPELDNPPTGLYVSNPLQPSELDLLALEQIVSEVAQQDPVVQGLLACRPWPDPEITPAYWVHEGADARTVLIGGGIELALGGVDYQGAWPQAGCSGGKYRGTVRNVDASGLDLVYLLVDLTYERVTVVSVGPTPVVEAGSSTPKALDIVYLDDLPDEPWYTGSCPRFSGRD